MPLRARTYIGSSVTSCAVEQDAARVGRRQADHHRERRRLAGAVGPEQADDFARRDLEVDAADDGAAAVRLGEVVVSAAWPCRANAFPPDTRLARLRSAANSLPVDADWYRPPSRNVRVPCRAISLQSSAACLRTPLTGVARHGVLLVLRGVGQVRRRGTAGGSLTRR